MGPCYSEQVASCRRLMLELEAGGSSGKGRRVCGGDRNDQKPLQELVPQEGGSCPTASALGGKRVLHEPLSPGPGAGGAQAQGRGPAVRVAAAHPAGGPHCGHCPPPTPWGAQEDPLWGRASEVPQPGGADTKQRRAPGVLDGGTGSPEGRCPLPVPLLRGDAAVDLVVPGEGGHEGAEARPRPRGLPPLLPGQSSLHRPHFSPSPTPWAPEILSGHCGSRTHLCTCCFLLTRVLPPLPPCPSSAGIHL